MLLLALSIACGPATIGVGDTGDPSNNGNNNGGDDTGETGDTEEPEPETSPFEGDYDGEMGLFVAEWDWELCEGVISVEVDEDGKLEGEMLCMEESNWGDWEIPGELEGSVDEDGEIEGTVVFEWETRDGVEEIEGELHGEVDEDGDMDLGWTAEVHMGGGRGGGDTEVEGWGKLD